MTTYIGKKIAVSIGGQPPQKNSDEIIGSETSVHMTEEEAKQYNRIVGEEINLSVGKDLDDQARNIIEAIQRADLDDNKKQQIINYCGKILSERNNNEKLSWVREVIAVGADVAQISSLIIQLGMFLPK